MRGSFFFKYGDDEVVKGKEEKVRINEVHRYGRTVRGSFFFKYGDDEVVKGKEEKVRINEARLYVAFGNGSLTQASETKLTDFLKTFCQARC